jgi:hypothetical protein
MIFAAEAEIVEDAYQWFYANNQVLRKPVERGFIECFVPVFRRLFNNVYNAWRVACNSILT